MAKSRSKRQKLVVDRISDLPESLLIHILSFLPTQKAITTSILSSRWKDLWTLVPKLDINTEELHPIVKHAHTVSRIFHLHKTPYLRTFRLTYSCGNRSDVDAWIGNVAARKVEELDLEIYDDEYWDFERLRLYHSHEIFSCKTLVVLNLRSRIVIDPPSSFQFPSLKILGLFYVDYKSDSLSGLLSGCPVLEDLSFESACLGGVRVLNHKICVPTLKRLSMAIEVYEYDFLKLLDYDDSDCSYRIEINTPALEYFKFNGHLSEVVFLQKLDNLVQADIHICTLKAANRIFKLLAAFYNVKFLSLFSGHSECLCNGSIYPFRFQNLLRLDFMANALNWHVLQALLRNAPNLEVLDVINTRHGSGNHKLCRCRKKSPNDSNFLSSHLTTFYYSEFGGFKDEVEFIKYILKEARVLKTASIRVRNIKLKKGVLQKLSMIRRRSMTSLLTFKK